MRFPGLTIFQKMLLAPVLAVALYSAYVLYAYMDTRRNTQSIETIYAHYLPALDVANQNAVLLEAIATTFKDAVLAGEHDWINTTREPKQRILQNLKQLGGYQTIVLAQHADELRSDFSDYYDNAYALSSAMLMGTANTQQSNTLIENVERYYVQSNAAFEQMQLRLAAQLQEEIQQVSQEQRRATLIGAAAGIGLLLLTLWVTILLSLSTRKNLRRVNAAMHDLAQDDPDFSRRLRLRRQSDDELGELIVSFNQLADKLEANYKHIEKLSITDKLTGLFNRTRIDQLLEVELRRAARYQQTFSVVLIDLDTFKQVNDTHGHQVGDQVLATAASILRTHSRAADHVGRWGGEEFILLLPGTALPDAVRFAEKLRTATQRHHFAVVEQQTFSAGVASYRNGDSVDTVIARADTALYLAKERGRNQTASEPLASPTKQGSVAAN